MSDRPENYMLWLTRPAEQVDRLLAALRAEGLSVLHIPMLEIEALEHDHESRQKILNLARYDLAFFISSNAAKLGMEYINACWPQYPAHIRTYALGPATARMLETYGVHADYPATSMSTETLLALPQINDAIQAIHGKEKRALIFRGVGGREKLAESLRELDVSVDYLELYRRIMPDYEKNFLAACMTDSFPDAVVITSAEALENFVHLFKPWLKKLSEVKLLVSSARLQELTFEAGFTKVIEMPGANDQAIISSIESDRKNHG